jgi:hypothetical protein
MKMPFAAVHESGFGTKLPFAALQNYVRFLGYSGREMLAVRLSHFDPTRTFSPRRIDLRPLIDDYCEQAFKVAVHDYATRASGRSPGLFPRL